jgi:hypothetical protein
LRKRPEFDTLFQVSLKKKLLCRRVQGMSAMFSKMACLH